MKTTKDHFKIFCAECYKWQEFFNLKDWELCILHEKIEDRGDLIYYPQESIAIIRLTTDWGKDKAPLTNNMVKRIAFHEIVELFLGRLNVFASERFVSSNEIITEERHKIIRTLENQLFEMAE